MIEVNPGIYRHFKGQLYQVFANGHEVDGDNGLEHPGAAVVIYRAMYTSESYGADHPWVRSVENFCGAVLLGDREVSRFTPVPIPELPRPDDQLLTVETLYEDSERSIATVVLNGINTRIINRRSRMTYEVLKGEGIMEVGWQSRSISVGDSVVIEAGTPYRDEGQMVLLATAQPPYDSNDVIVLP